MNGFDVPSHGLVKVCLDFRSPLEVLFEFPIILHGLGVSGVLPIWTSGPSVLNSSKSDFADTSVTIIKQ
jgi:hypothetical protein